MCLISVCSLIDHKLKFDSKFEVRAKLIEHPLQFSHTLSLRYRKTPYNFPGVIFRECLGFMLGTWTLGSLRGISKTSLGFSAFSAMFG
ncbi:hypothetical protein V6N13_069620 [Hibiscus sabdariffa]